MNLPLCRKQLKFLKGKEKMVYRLRQFLGAISTTKLIWFIYTSCVSAMTAMTLLGRWSRVFLWILFTCEVVVTILTFAPKATQKIHSYAVTLTALVCIFSCSVMDNEFYPYVTALLVESIVILAYKDEKVMLTNLVGSMLMILHHIFYGNAVIFGVTNSVIELVLCFAIIAAVQIFLTLFILTMKKNETVMRKSMESARRAEHSKADFLANMSHEIRTPMNGILGMCEIMLRDASINDDAKENCFNIRTSAKSLLAIINDILDFSKIDSGKMEIIEEPFNMASTLNDVLNLAMARKGSKKIEFIIVLDPSIPCGIIGDENRIRQIMVNLLTNAIKFTEKGAITVTVSQNRQDYGINLMISVADTGIGISQENIEQLFTSFQQVDTRKNRSVEGTGLGLAICKKLVSSMGGFINVKSEYGIGSEFRFVIPLKVSDSKPFMSVKESESIHAVSLFNMDKFNHPEIPRRYSQIISNIGAQLGIDYANYTNIDALKKRASEKAITHCFISADEYLKNREYFNELSRTVKITVVQERTDSFDVPASISRVFKPFYALSIVSALNNENLIMNLNERRGSDIHFTAPKARVLIVDDNDINLKVAWGLMRPYNMQVLTAESGPAAINMLRSKDIDLVFMDHMMPEMDGVEATHKIREMEGDYYKQLPIIALTANAISGVKDMFISEGLNDFMAKPIELTALDRMLRNYLPPEYIQPCSAAVYSGPERRKSFQKNKDAKTFDPESGLALTGGDADAYGEILRMYVQKGKDKREYIQKLYESGDWKNYIIEVHALKSTSMTVGAAKLSELARELEGAGKEQNYDLIHEKQNTLYEMYGSVINIIREYVNANYPQAGQPEELYIPNAQALTEITEALLKEYISVAKQAIEAFDSDETDKIAEQTKNLSYHSKPLADSFGRAASLMRDFEYDSAMEVISVLEQQITAGIK